MFVYDPRKGDTIRDRLSLQGNPAVKEDWYTIKKTGETIDFITFARSEGRFSKQFDKEGNPSEVLMAAQADRLANWHLLQGDGWNSLNDVSTGDCRAIQITREESETKIESPCRESRFQTKSAT